MPPPLPPMRALQEFEAFGRRGSVGGAAQELGVTAGAISQQLKLLEAHSGLTLIIKDGRRAALTPDARTYHELVTCGFETLRLAQDYLAQQRSSGDLRISGLPTLLLKWLNALLHRFHTDAPGVAARLEATHREPDPRLLEQMFRLTYGEAARRYPHSRVLFTDTCFPVASRDFLDRHPEARDPAGLARLPL